VKPAPFEYFRPRALDEALALLSQHGDAAKPLAGGQSLIPAMNFRLGQPAALVDLNEIRELAYIEARDGELRIGGMTRQRAIERSSDARRAVPLLAETLPFIAHPAIRNRGTIGGSLAHADPAAELPAVCVALQGRVRAQSTRGSRWIAAGDLFTGLMATSLEPDELLVEVALPAQAARTRVAFEEISRRLGDYALVGVAAVVSMDERGSCTAARVVLLSVGDRPIAATRAAQMLVGQEPTTDLIRAVADLAAREEIDPHSDVHASSDYRRHLAAVLTRRALTRATQRAAD
jgi:CO/xanthine dehydrogenase FAD-binding subunit